MGDLADFGRRTSGQIIHSLCIRHGNASFVDDMVEFLFDFDKGFGTRVRCAVGAQSEFFLVCRPVERTADEPEIRGVIIDVADCRLGKPVGHHTRLQDHRQIFILFWGHQIFFS